MIHRRFLTSVLCLVSLLLVTDYAFAAGGTSIVATKGQPTSVSRNWPKGVGELVNDSSRTSGWNSWFSEWPNDVNQYAFEIESTEDLNRLITKLAAIKTDLRQIRLSHLREPNALGWVTRVPKGSGIPVIFSIGDQVRIDKWFKHVRKPFGVMEFTATPEAVPPTLTIFVQNESVRLDELTVPNGIEVTLGYAPAVFHKSNTTFEQQREEAGHRDVARELKTLKQNLDGSALKAIHRIEAFLNSRKMVSSCRRASCPGIPHGWHLRTPWPGPGQGFLSHTR